MNDSVLTVVGNLVDEPRMRVTKNGHSVTNFRVASTSRRYDAEQSKWVDNATFSMSRLGRIAGRGGSCSSRAERTRRWRPTTSVGLRAG